MNYLAYFYDFGELAKDALDKLQGRERLDAQMDSWNLERVQNHKLAAEEYERQRRENAQNRAALQQELLGALDRRLAEYEAELGRDFMPDAAKIDKTDAETLQKFELTSAQFETMAAKHLGNTSMELLLDAYRKEHNLRTDWRPQSAEARRQIAKNAVVSIQSTMRNPLLDTDEKKARIGWAAAHGYHQISCSDPQELQAERPVRSDSVFF